MLAGVRDVLVISTPSDTPRFRATAGFGRAVGDTADVRGAALAGWAGASVSDRQEVSRWARGCCLVLGDNHVLPGTIFAKLMRSAAEDKEGATVFAYPVQDPERYGVVEFDEASKAISLEEKPAQPKSRYAVSWESISTTARLWGSLNRSGHRRAASWRSRT